MATPRLSLGLTAAQSMDEAFAVDRADEFALDIADDIEPVVVATGPHYSV